MKKNREVINKLSIERAITLLDDMHVMTNSFQQTNSLIITGLKPSCHNTTDWSSYVAMLGCILFLFS